MRYAIWGAGNVGEWFINLVANTKFLKHNEIVCFGDSDEKKIGTTKCGIPIKSRDEIADLFCKNIVDGVLIVVKAAFHEDIIQGLVEKGSKRQTTRLKKY